MIEEYVGKENLPNVFIDRIEFENIINGENRFAKMSITLCMYDEPLSTWSSGKIPDLEVSIVAVVGAEKNNLIKLGTHPVNALYSEEFDTSSISRSFNASSFTEVDDFSSEYEGMKKFTKEVEIISPNFSDNELSVYCYCTIKDLGFNIPEFDKFCGPVAGEEVYKSNSLVQDSGYFFDPETNREYGGPVHVVNSKYYKGSFASDNQEEVFFVSETNMKIVLPLGG